MKNKKRSWKLKNGGIFKDNCSGSMKKIVYTCKGSKVLVSPSKYISIAFI